MLLKKKAKSLKITSTKISQLSSTISPNYAPIQYKDNPTPKNPHHNAPQSNKPQNKTHKSSTP